METGSRPLSVRRSVLVAGIIGLICATPAPGQSVCEVDHVFASDGGGFHNFGRAVAVSGDTSLMGAYTASRAYVFRFDGTHWVETQKLLASDGAVGERFGRSVAVDGGTLMVGAPGHVHGPGVAGAVYVFVHDGSQWVEVQELIASEGVLGAFAVSLDGDVAVVGNWADSDNGSAAGAAAWAAVRGGWGGSPVAVHAPGGVWRVVVATDFAVTLDGSVDEVARGRFSDAFVRSLV